VSEDEELQFRDYAAGLAAAADPGPALVPAPAVLSSSSSEDSGSSSGGSGITGEAGASGNARDTPEGSVELGEPGTLRGPKIKGKSRALQVEELEEEVSDPFSSDGDDDLEMEESEEGISDSFGSFGSDDGM
jgi:hypothetical protein